MQTFNFRIDLDALPKGAPLVTFNYEDSEFIRLAGAVKKAIDGGVFHNLTDYAPIWKYFRCNNRKGLFLYGGCGCGKTFLAKYVYRQLLYNKGIAPTVIDAIDMADHLSELSDTGRHYYILDDIGTERPKQEYGNTIDAFVDLVYKAEERGVLLIITTNYDAEQFIERYGQRVYSRIKQLCECVNLGKVPDYRLTGKKA